MEKPDDLEEREGKKCMFLNLEEVKEKTMIGEELFYVVGGLR